TTEKSYLLGKFARGALGTRHIDYNGRLCMVSAGVAYKLAFGVDRSPNPYSDIPQPDVVLIARSNTAAGSPSPTDHVWRLRDLAGQLIVIATRMPCITRNADLYLPVRPGTDLALFLAMLHVMLRQKLEKRGFLDQYTAGFDAVAESAKSWTP